MNRKKFIKNCGLTCFAGIGLASLLEGCSSTKILSGKIVDDDLVIPLSDFYTNKNSQSYYKKYIIVQHDILQYPVCVYRLSEIYYTALWMRCTHQGTELLVFGTKLQCPAHGSEFDNEGGVQNGPADLKLRTFPVTVENNQLKISLKAV